MKTKYRTRILAALLITLGLLIFSPKLNTQAYADERANFGIQNWDTITSYSEQFIDNGNQIEVDINLAEPPPGTGCASIWNPGAAFTQTAQSCTISGNTVTADFLTVPTDEEVTYPAHWFLLFSNDSGGYVAESLNTFIVDPSTITSPPTTIYATPNLANWNIGTVIDISSVSQHFINNGNSIEADINLAEPPPTGTTGCEVVYNPTDALTGTAQSCTVSGNTVTADFATIPTDVTYPADWFIIFNNYPTDLGFTNTYFTVDPSTLPTPPAVGTISFNNNPVQINSSTTATASFTDTAGGSNATAQWKWGDGSTTSGTVTESNGSGSVTNNHTYTSLGSYTVTLTVTNSVGSTSSQTVVSVIPTGGLANGNLSHTNYNGANLSNQDLTKTNGTNGSFQNVNFSSATLTQANFSGSNLTGSNFTNANLTKANLSNDNLTNVNFTGANLTQANLSNTTLTGVTWSNTTCPDGTNSNNDGNTCVGHL